MREFEGRVRLVYSMCSGLLHFQAMSVFWFWVVRYFLARQVAAKNRFHICTVESKLGAGECNARLVDLLPNTDRREGRLRTLLKWAPLLW